MYQEHLLKNRKTQHQSQIYSHDSFTALRHGFHTKQANCYLPQTFNKKISTNSLYHKHNISFKKKIAKIIINLFVIKSALQAILFEIKITQTGIEPCYFRFAGGYDNLFTTKLFYLNDLDRNRTVLLQRWRLA